MPSRLTNISADLSTKEDTKEGTGYVSKHGDIESHTGLQDRISRLDNATYLYKRMLTETWSFDEEKTLNRSVSKMSNQPNAVQACELLFRAGNDELPIVGYAPVFAQKSSLRRDSAKLDPPPVPSLGKPEEPPPQPLTEEQSFTKSDQMFANLLDDLNAQSYVTPFDKFVPHESQLPELDPSVEAKLLATSEVDPVRGVFEQNLEKEIADHEGLLTLEKRPRCHLEHFNSLPSYESYASRNEELQRKMKENMQFWRNISRHEKPKPPTDQELKLLDYAALCNMYTGIWGMDEDSMMLQFFYKFQYDDSWRERLKKGCFNMLDECNPDSCGVCKEVTDEEVAKMKPESFFEIEDSNDYENIVVKIKEEFNKKFDDGTNWDFKQLIMNPVDSDLDSDSFVSDSELELCVDEKPSSKDWILAKGVWIAPKGFDDPPKDEEDLLPKDMNCKDIELLSYRNIVPQKPGDQAALESATLEMMRTKYEKKRADEKKGYFWRAKSNYLYRWPDFKKKSKKK